MRGVFETTGRAIALGAALFLAACETEQGAGDGLTSAADDRQLCRQVETLLISGQRNSFGLRFSDAENAFAELLSIYSLEDVTARCPKAPSRAFILMNQALAYSSQERFVTANGLFDLAAELLADGREIPPRRLERERALYTAYRAQDLLNRSEALSAREFAEAAAVTFPGAAGGDLVARDSSFSQLMLEVSADEKRRVIDEASNSHARAHILLLEGELDKAGEAINHALNLVDLVPRSAAVYRPRFLAERALINFEKGELELAREDAAGSAQGFADLMPGSPLEARAQLSLGRTLATLERTDEALAVFERGFSIYEENPVIVDYRSLWPFFRIALREMRRQPERRQELAARMFRAAQVIRRSITAQTVSGAAALLGEGEGAKGAAVRAWRQAEEEFATLKALQVIQLQDPLNQREQTERLARQVNEARARVERLKATRDQIAPEYQSAISSPVTLAQVQDVLEPGEALVQIVTGAPRSLIFIVDKTSVEVRSIRATETQLAVLVSNLRRAVLTRADGSVPAFRADFASVLFNLLFSEVKERLTSHDSLIISTSGALQSFPLELLVTEQPGPAATAAWARRGDYTDVAWLGAEQAVSYVPSPRNLVDIRRRAGVSRAVQDVAAYGDFRPGVDPRKVLRIADLPDSCFDLARAVDTIGGLPGTAAEAEAIAAVFGSGAEISTGDTFTEAALKTASDNGELADFKVLHFATHGILWPTPDCFTDPALTVTATADEQSDGLLTAREIRGLSMDAQLIVLSACNTASTYLEGLGDAAMRAGDRGISARAGKGGSRAAGVIRESGAGGESLSGLARAFFSAGARTVLATHWPVADAETTRLMRSFYQRLDDGGVTFAAALRSAQGELRQRPETSHPIFWGPFVLIGDGAQTLRPDGAPVVEIDVVESQ